MKKNLYSEQMLIEKITRQFKTESKDVVIGIGDDAAVIKNNDDLLIATCDSQIEGVHFKKEWINSTDLGKRAVAVAVSDIAAMGGTPEYILVSLAIPKNEKKSFIDKLYIGIKQACKIYNVTLIGGNLSTAGQIVIDVTVLGTAKKSQIVSRSGAEPGDVVLVTGLLGNAAMGLRALKLKVKSEKLKVSIERFRNPTPRIKEGMVIAKSKKATAMIDISDGLAKDLLRICEASKVGVRLFANAIPRAKPVPLDLALYGGEDYELLFTIAKKDAPYMQLLIKKETGTNVSIIGEILPQKEGRVLVRVDGKEEKLRDEGFDHFK